MDKVVNYSPNNSGGYWWMNHENYLALEADGWDVKWEDYMGSTAHGASLKGVSLRVAIARWEDATGLSSNALGCSCCGPPHQFYYFEDDKMVDDYSPEAPQYGEDY